MLSPKEPQIHIPMNSIEATHTLFCDVCGKEVDGTYYTDNYGRISCHRHKVHQCYCCGRFYNPLRCSKISPYGLFCPDCQKSRIDTSSVHKIANLINLYFQNNGLEIPPYSLKLINEDRMVSITGSSNTLGFATNSDPYKITIIRHLSRTGLAAVLAHEVLHLWQYKHGFNTPDLLSEGMCELGSFLFLKSINRKEADHHFKAIEQNTDKTYGGGFRLFKSIYQKFGWEGVIKALILRNNQQ